MKTLLSIVAIAAVLTLSGCAPDKHITEVKALPFSYPNENVRDPNLTVDQALDYRKVCDSAKWKVDMTEQHQTFVEYHCTYKGVSDSTFGERDNSHLDSAEDVYQWTYNVNGQPKLSYVGFNIHYKNGTSKDFKLDATHVMELASNNKATNFDEAFSYLIGAPIPVKPASPITDTTYGNTLTSLYPGHSAMDAAVLTYRWIKSPLTIYDIDGLEYPMMDGACIFQGEMKCAALTGPNSDRREFTMTDLASHLFPVNPKDVEYAVKPSHSSDWEIVKPHSPNKLACVGLTCFDIQGRLVGSAPASIVAKEGSSAPVPEPSATQPPAATQSTQTMATPAATVHSGDVGPDGWPKMTPCIQKLQDKFTTDQQKQNADTSTSLEQMQEWADVCKSLGQ